MVTMKEVQLYLPYATEESCNTVARYIKNLYVRRHGYLDEAEYDVEVVRILQRAGENYDPKLGHLVRYVKNTLSLKLKDYISRNYQKSSQLDEDTIVDKAVELVVDHDLSEYSDSTIQAIYNVVKGKSTKKDRDIVNSLFSTDKED